MQKLNLRSIRFKLADTIEAFSWEWHILSVIVALFSLAAIPHSLWLLVFPAISLVLIATQQIMRRGFRTVKSGSKPATAIHINNDYLTLNLGLGVTRILERKDIQRVAFYKTDEITADLICCEITAAKNNDTSKCYVHEKQDCFHSVVSWLSMLASFDPLWRNHVMNPEFSDTVFIAFEQG